MVNIIKLCLLSWFLHETVYNREPSYNLLKISGKGRMAKNIFAKNETQSASKLTQYTSKIF